MKNQQSKKVCRYFLQGRCRFGQNCRYSHFYVQCFLMRHAESEFNYVANSSQNSMYSQQAKNQYQMDSKLIDCGITKEGVNEIRKMRFPEEMTIDEDLCVDVIFVSPLKRALDTVMQIITTHKIKYKKVIVLPNLTEVLSKICDLCGKIQEKVKEYDRFDFSRFSKIVNTQWQDELVDSSIKNEIEIKNICAWRYLKMLQKYFPQPLESSQSCFYRTLNVLDQIRDICQQSNYGRALIVSHNRVLKYICGRFNQGREKSFANCEIRIDQI